MTQLFQWVLALMSSKEIFMCKITKINNHKPNEICFWCETMSHFKTTPLVEKKVHHYACNDSVFMLFINRLFSNTLDIHGRLVSHWDAPCSTRYNSLPTPQMINGCRKVTPNTRGVIQSVLRLIFHIQPPETAQCTTNVVKIVDEVVTKKNKIRHPI